MSISKPWMVEVLTPPGSNWFIVAHLDTKSAAEEEAERRRAASPRHLYRVTKKD